LQVLWQPQSADFNRAAKLNCRLRREIRRRLTAITQIEESLEDCLGAARDYFGNRLRRFRCCEFQSSFGDTPKERATEKLVVLGLPTLSVFREVENSRSTPRDENQAAEQSLPLF